METDERRSPTPLRPTLTRFPPSCHGRNERSERGRGVRWVHDIFWSIPCILLLHVMNPPHPHPASRRDGHEGRERKEGAGYGVSFSESFRVHVVHVNPVSFHGHVTSTLTHFLPCVLSVSERSE